MEESPDDAKVEAEQASLIRGTHQAVELAEASLSVSNMVRLLAVLRCSLAFVEHIQSVVLEVT